MKKKTSLAIIAALVAADNVVVYAEEKRDADYVIKGWMTTPRRMKALRFALTKAKNAIKADETIAADDEALQ